MYSKSEELISPINREKVYPFASIPPSVERGDPSQLVLEPRLQDALAEPNLSPYTRSFDEVSIIGGQ